MTDNQHAHPVSEPGSGVPSGQQAYPPQAPPQPQAHQPQASQPQSQEYASQPYPPQQYPPAYPGEPYPGQQQDPYTAQTPYTAQAPFPPGQVPPAQYPQAPYPQGPYAQGPYPPAPYPQGSAQQTPYPQAPYAQGSAQPSAYPQGPQQPPYPPAGYAPMPGQPPRRTSRAPLILGITGGVVVLAVVAALLVPRLGVPRVVAPSPSGPATVVVQTATAESAVQGYLEALAQGDAATAVAYAASLPSDTSMLTSGVLAAGLAIAPLTDIQVSPGSGGSSSDTIDATYRLGDRMVSASFPVARVGSAWRLERPLAKVTLASLQPEELALRLNGTPITTDSLVVFPGVYTVTSDDARYAVSSGAFMVQSPDDRPDTYSMRVALSAEGRTLVRAAAHKKLSSCIKQRSLKPAGCGFGTRLPAGNKARTSTIRWRITKGSDAMKKLKPTVVGSDPTQLRADVDVQLKVTLKSTNGRGWFGNSGIYLVRADLSGPGVTVSLG